MPQKKQKEYYAVVQGRIDEPTIYSSWGDAHPRVTGCASVHKAFRDIEAARKYMSNKGVSRFKEMVKSTAQDTTPEMDTTGFYAVANGANTGIYERWYGKSGAEQDTTEVSGACHKWFETKGQAEAFIEDWKESFADVWRMNMKRALDGGLRPRNMTVKAEEILYTSSEDRIVDELTCRLGTGLGLGAA